MALTDSIQAYWKLDESSGNAADSTANANTLTNEGVTYASGKINNGADFERSEGSDILRITNAAQTGLNFSAGDAFSFNFWINFESTPSSGEIYIFIDKENVAGTQGYKFYYYNNGGTLEFRVDINDGANHTYVQAATLSTATWYMITLTWSGASTTLTYYVNAASQGTDTTVGTITDSTADFRVGWDDSAGRDFDGLIDELGVWSRELTGAEVTSLYNSGAGIQYPFTSGPASVKTWDGVATGTIVTLNTLAIGSIKSINGVT